MIVAWGQKSCLPDSLWLPLHFFPTFFFASNNTRLPGWNKIRREERKMSSLYLNHSQKIYGHNLIHQQHLTYIIFIPCHFPFQVLSYASSSTYTLPLWVIKSLNRKSFKLAQSPGLRACFALIGALCVTVHHTVNQCTVAHVFRL